MKPFPQLVHDKTNSINALVISVFNGFDNSLLYGYEDVLDGRVLIISNETIRLMDPDVDLLTSRLNLERLSSEDFEPEITSGEFAFLLAQKHGTWNDGRGYQYFFTDVTAFQPGEAVIVRQFENWIILVAVFCQPASGGRVMTAQLMLIFSFFVTGMMFQFCLKKRAPLWFLLPTAFFWGALNWALLTLLSVLLLQEVSLVFLLVLNGVEVVAALVRVILSKTLSFTKRDWLLILLYSGFFIVVAIVFSFFNLSRVSPDSLFLLKMADQIATSGFTHLTWTSPAAYGYFVSLVQAAAGALKLDYLYLFQPVTHGKLYCAHILHHPAFHRQRIPHALVARPARADRGHLPLHQHHDAFPVRVHSYQPAKRRLPLLPALSR